jgi:hypothetical protein
VMARARFLMARPVPDAVRLVSRWLGPRILFGAHPVSSRWLTVLGARGPRALRCEGDKPMPRAREPRSTGNCRRDVASIETPNNRILGSAIVVNYAWLCSVRSVIPSRVEVD